MALMAAADKHRLAPPKSPSHDFFPKLNSDEEEQERKEEKSSRAQSVPADPKSQKELANQKVKEHGMRVWRLMRS